MQLKLVGKRESLNYLLMQEYCMWYTSVMANNSKTPTLKQKLFAAAYVKHKGNASKAALEVYDVKKEHSSNLGHQLIEKPVVQEEIAKQLDAVGLDLETLHKKSLSAINDNLKYGKYSQSAGISHLQFLYKLHNAVPVSKKMTMNLSLRDQMPSQDFNDLKKSLEKMNETTQALLKEIKG